METNDVFYMRMRRWQESIERRRRFLRKGFRVLGLVSGIFFCITAMLNLNFGAKAPPYPYDVVMIVGAISFFCLVVVEKLFFEKWEP